MKKQIKFAAWMLALTGALSSHAGVIAAWDFGSSDDTTSSGWSAFVLADSASNSISYTDDEHLGSGSITLTQAESGGWSARTRTPDAATTNAPPLLVAGEDVMNDGFDLTIDTQDQLFTLSGLVLGASYRLQFVGQAKSDPSAMRTLTMTVWSNVARLHEDTTSYPLNDDISGYSEYIEFEAASGSVDLLFEEIESGNKHVGGLIVEVTGSGATNPPVTNYPADVVTGETIALKASSGFYVTANNNGSYWGTIPYPDLALADTYYGHGDGYAQFAVEDTGDGTIALRCLGNNKYVTVDAGTKELRATVDVVSGNNQKFTVVTNLSGSGAIGLISAYNARYVTTGGTNPLEATQSSMGTGESFEFELLGEWPTAPFDFVGNLATNLMPEPIGNAATANLLGREHYWQSSGDLHYSEYYTANGALRFARATENTSLFNSVFDRYNTPTWPYKDGTYTLTSLTNDTSLFMGPAPGNLQRTRTAVILLEWYKSTGNTDYYNKAVTRYGPSRGGTTSYPNADSMFMEPTLERTIYELPALSPSEKTDCINNVSEFLSGYTSPVMQKDNGLYMHHPTDSNQTDPLSFEVWGRGAGWCNMALAEGLTILPDTDPRWDNTCRSYLKFMDGLLGCQHTSGMWYQVMDRPGESSPGGYANWLESSGTAMACYAIVRGVKEGWLDASVYGPAIRNAWQALATRIDGSGALQDVCRGMSEARLAEGLDYYMNEDDRDVTGDFHGQAPLLWLASELIENDFNSWAMEFGLLGTDAFMAANTDGDSQSNFEEYVFGGDPTDDTVQGWQTTASVKRSGGGHWAEFVYPRRTGTGSGLSYQFVATDNLIDGIWSNVSSVVEGTAALDDNFEAVTSRVDFGEETKQFIRLKIERH